VVSNLPGVSYLFDVIFTIMYFDPQPKNKKEDLYNFEKEYNALHNAIKRNERIIVIKGIRRTGKTSLMKVVYNELNVPKIFIDGRVIPPKQGEIFNTLLENSIFALTESFADLKIRKLVKEIGISFGASVKFSLSAEIKSFEKIDKILQRKRTKLIMFIDEAQKLKAGNISGIIAHLFEHTKNVIVVIAGSEIGILDAVIGKDAESDLYGRPKKLIELRRLEKENSIEFLRIGFKQCKKKIDEEYILEAIETFDGIIGWLTLFGYYSLQYDAREAIEIVKKEGSKIVAKEIEHFLQLRMEAKERYLKLMEALSTPLRWVEVKRFLEAHEGKKINDKMVTKYLHELQKYGFISHRDRRYSLADPMIKEAINLLTSGK